MVPQALCMGISTRCCTIPEKQCKRFGKILLLCRHLIRRPTEICSIYGNNLGNEPVFYDEINGLRYTGIEDPLTRNLMILLPPMPQRGRVSLIDESRVEMLPFFRVDTVSQINYNYHVGNCEFLMDSSRTLVSPKGELNDCKALLENCCGVQLNLVQDLYEYFSYGLAKPQGQ